MPIKHTRPDCEVQALADEFAQAGNSSKTVMGWLRQNERKVSDLIHEEGWSWSDIGRALDCAGIAYATDTPWNGTILRSKAAKARAQNARAKAKRAAHESSTTFEGSLRFGNVGKVFVTMTDPINKQQIPQALDPEPEAKPTSSRLALDGLTDDDEFQFGTVSFAKGKPVTSLGTTEQKKTSPTYQTKKNADEVLKTLFSEKG